MKEEEKPKTNFKTNFNFNKASSSFKFILLAELGKTFDNTTTVGEILKKFNFASASALYYYEKKFMENGLLEKISKFPKRYNLTSLGRSIIKKILVPLEAGKTSPDVWRFHHYIRGYKIIDYGKFSFDDHKLVPMRNWSYIQKEIKIAEDKTVKIQIQTTGLIKVFAPQIYGIEYDKLKEIANEQCSKAVHKLIQQYDMKLDAGRPIRRPHYALVDSQRLGKLLINVDDPRFWVDFSLGLEEVETHEPEHLQNLLDMPKQMDALMNNLTPVLIEFSSQIKLHLEVMSHIQISLAKQTALFEKMSNVLDRISRGNNDDSTGNEGVSG